MWRLANSVRAGGLVRKTVGVASPSASDVAALARSSPWRWSTLRFTAAWPGDPWRTQNLRAWLRRPDRLRVETVAGRAGVVTSAGDRYTATLPWWTAPDAPRPLLRPDGLVAARADPLASGVSFDAPMYRDYFWVAMLDPVELADGRSPDADAAVPGTEIDAVAEVEHGGRPAWEAIVRPTPAYAPRCTCCSLLRSREVDVAEAASGAGDKVVLDEYPQAYRVRLDVGTGVCVLTEAIGGSTSGSGHELRIEAVDEPMGDDLFPSRPPSGPPPGPSPRPGSAPSVVHSTATTR